MLNVILRACEPWTNQDPERCLLAFLSLCDAGFNFFLFFPISPRTHRKKQRGPSQLLFFYVLLFYV